MSDDPVIQWVEGQKVVARRGMTAATGNFYAGLHEFGNMMVLLHFLREGDLFIDIGANIGSFTVLASGVCRATTWAFEPDSVTADHLRRNVAINDLVTLATVYEAALGASEGQISFSVGLDSMNHVVVGMVRGAQKVRQLRLDDLVGTARPIMLKIDVEAYEEQVLEGATGLLGREELKVIEIETVTPRIADLLAQNRFEEVSYDPFTRCVSAKTARSASNALYIRNREFVCARLKHGRAIHVLDRLI